MNKTVNRRDYTDGERHTKALVLADGTVRLSATTRGGCGMPTATAAYIDATPARLRELADLAEQKTAP